MKHVFVYDENRHPEEGDIIISKLPDLQPAVVLRTQEAPDTHFPVRYFGSETERNWFAHDVMVCLGRKLADVKDMSFDQWKEASGSIEEVFVAPYLKKYIGKENNMNTIKVPEPQAAVNLRWDQALLDEMCSAEAEVIEVTRMVLTLAKRILGYENATNCAMPEIREEADLFIRMTDKTANIRGTLFEAKMALHALAAHR